MSWREPRASGDVFNRGRQAPRISSGNNWLPGMDSHHHARLQRAMSYELDDPAMNWWPARVTRPVLRIKSPLHHFNACRPNGARGRTRTCTGDALNVVPLHWATRANGMGPPAGVAPARFLYKRNPQAAAWRQRWSQSPVLPRTMRAYETHLSAGSTAEPFGRLRTSPHPELHRAKFAYRANASLTML